MTDDEAAVVAAAKKWIAAKEAVLAADESNEDPVPTEYAIGQAEGELTDAVYRLLGREPRIPHKG
jgi:hypothetical protein